MIPKQRIVRARRAPNPHVIVQFDLRKLPKELKYEPFDENKLVYLSQQLQDDLKRVSPDLSLRPLFRGMSVADWQRMVSIAKKKDSPLNPFYRNNVPDFTEYFDITGPRNADFCRIAAILNRSSEVKRAYVERVALAPQDQPFRWAAPAGIDVPAARQVVAASSTRQPHGSGSNVKFVDVEEGWNLNHVQLQTGQLTLPAGEYNNPNEAAHGTAVLGILSALEDEYGPEGIAPGAQGFALCSVDQQGNPTHQAAIQRAGSHLQAGDVLVIEVHIYESSTSGRRVPVEAVGDATFWEIATLVGNDIVVVEAGGNGDEWTGDPIDFDTYPDPVSGDLVLNPGVRHSGAIMVSAADMPVPGLPNMARTPYAPYGARIDCFAWGNGVYTCWDDGLGTNSAYIDNFPGTSAATAIVAGAAILLQDVAKDTHSKTLSPDRILTLFHDQANTPCPADPRIGRMPNLAALIGKLP